MLIDLIKNSVALRADDKFEIHEEEDNSQLNKKIIKSFLEKDDDKRSSETEYYLNVNDSSIFPSFTMSVVNRPLVNNFTGLVKMVNDASIKFNKTNVSFSIINKKPIIVITTSFFFLDDIEDLLFKNMGYFDYDGESEESKSAATKIASIFGSMIIALLETSMFIDEVSINMMDELIKKEHGGNDGEK